MVRQAHHVQTVCIIGGGFAGLAAAVFLDNLGFEVSLFEKKPVLGGRTYSFRDKKTGDWVDNGQHLLIGAYHETLKLLGNIGATRHLKIPQKTEVALISDQNKPLTFTLPRLPVPFNLMVSFLRMNCFTWSDRFHFLKMGLELHKTAPSETVLEWLKRHKQSGKAICNFWEPLTYATLNDDPSVAEAAMLKVVLTKGFLSSPADSRMVLAVSHLNDLLAKPALTYLTLRGQKIKTGVGITKIHLLDGKVQGVELEDGEMIKSDIYISAVPFASLLRLIPEGFIDSIPYFGNLKKLSSAPIVSINLWFDRDVIPHDFVGAAGKKVHWYFNKNRIYGKDESPFHVMGVISGAYNLNDSSKEEIQKIVLAEMKELFPKMQEAILVHSLINKEREATLSPKVGSDECRPTQQSPFENFFVIGDWTNTGLPATIESAVVSAKLAVNLIQTRLQSSPPTAQSHLPE